ncbi:MAG: CPBP family intramembrane glutamic endopeptidase [Candidatus Eisenbacteria bacterium]
MNGSDQQSPLDDGGLAADGGSPARSTTPPAHPRSVAAVAPAWHTAFLLAYLAGFTWLSASSAPGEGSVPSASRPVIYLTVLAFQWILFGIATWGFRLRGVSIGAILSYRWKGWNGVWRCSLLAAACWIATFMGVATAIDATGMRDPAQVRRVVEMIAPRGPLELAIWTSVAVTAGFVEEIVFRGYLQRQFTAWTRNHLAGIALSAFVFGAGHLYQGVASAALIMVVGLCFSLSAYATRSLVPGVIAHAWEDLISGIAGRG